MHINFLEECLGLTAIFNYFGSRTEYMSKIDML